MFSTVIFAAPPPDTPLEAWWLRVTFLPAQTAYEALPAQAIDPEWVKISILSYGTLPVEAKPDFGWMRQDGFDFQIDNYFKRKGLIDRELCGVYEDRMQHRGRFLLVLERAKEAPWKVVFLHQVPGDAGFNVLRRKRNGLFWCTCMQCGEFRRLRLKHGNFYLDAVTARRYGIDHPIADCGIITI